MESIYVIVAEKSQLVRMGISGILYQTGFPLTLREVTEPEKLDHAIKKEHKGLLIISSSFLAICNQANMKQQKIKYNEYYTIVIEDITLQSPNHIEINDIIILDDAEKTIYNKIQKGLQKVSKPFNHGRPVEEISHREKDVLKLVAAGMTNKEIADRLYISLHTVITHRKNITAKLGIKTIAGLTVYAMLNKLISTEDIK
jgi:DNA-binding CsgD family transcriptional regulator